MFDQIIKELYQKLDEIRPKLNKCHELKEKMPAGETKNKLEQKYSELHQAVDRAAICISILKFEVSFEPSDDYMTVRFPRV